MDANSDTEYEIYGTSGSEYYSTSTISQETPFQTLSQQELDDIKAQSILNTDSTDQQEDEEEEEEESTTPVMPRSFSNNQV